MIVDVVVMHENGQAKHSNLLPLQAIDLGAEAESYGCDVKFYEAGTETPVTALRLASYALGLRH